MSEGFNKMDIKSGDPGDNLTIILEEYKTTPNTFGLNSSLEEKKFFS